MQLEDFRQKYCYDQATPMMQQYLDIKFANIDCLILFRMGDFYELFFEDAIEAAQVLGLALTKRGKTGEDDVRLPSKLAPEEKVLGALDAENRSVHKVREDLRTGVTTQLPSGVELGKKSIAMCGIPHHALENYLNRLIEEGYKVAICDQLETPEEAKKRGGYKAVVRRDITRIITPGTIIEESLLKAAAPSYLASLVIGKTAAAICFVDLSTSEIAVIEIPKEDIISELARIAPKEILLSESLRSDGLANIIHHQLQYKISYQVDSFFAYNKCQKIITEFYKISSINAIGTISDIQTSAIGSVLEYISLTQRVNIPALPLPKILQYGNFLHIDAATRANLELTSNIAGQFRGSLLSVIDNTVTKTGSRLLYKFLSAPLIDISLINERLEITEFFLNNLQVTSNIRSLLKKTGDLERCLTRVSMNRSTPRDLLSIKYTLASALQIKGEFLNQFGIRLPSHIERLTHPLNGDAELEELIENAIREDAPNNISDGGIIKYTFHPKVEELYNLINDGKSCIEELRLKYRKETDIDGLKISHNNVLGLFIEVTSRHSSKITDSKFIHRQTTSTGVRYTTTELQKLESDMVNARALVVNLEQELYFQICKKIIEKAPYLVVLSDHLAKIDVFCNFAVIADEYNYCKPELTNDLTFEIKSGRHSVVELSLKKLGQAFVSNDCFLAVRAAGTKNLNNPPASAPGYDDSHLNLEHNALERGADLVVGRKASGEHPQSVPSVGEDMRVLTLDTANTTSLAPHHTEDISVVARKISGELAQPTKVGEHKRIPQSDTANTEISKVCRVWLITGPNMSGKSTFLRQNALIAILAQIGCFVPAAYARIGVVDKIFSRIGSGDNLLKGQSTFMVEMLETSAILAQATERSLIILDEVGRGTSTYDGMAIAWSVLEYIHDKIKCRCLFATHYHELTSMSNFLPALQNYTVAIEELVDNILFLHHIIPGTADKSYGIHVAKLAGLPKSVIRRANEIVSKFEKNGNAQNKNILKSEASSLSLFDFEGKKSESENKINVKYKQLEETVNNIDPDQLSPKEALEMIYKLKNISNELQKA